MHLKSDRISALNHSYFCQIFATDFDEVAKDMHCIVFPMNGDEKLDMYVDNSEIRFLALTVLKKGKLKIDQRPQTCV